MSGVLLLYVCVCVWCCAGGTGGCGVMGVNSASVCICVHACICAMSASMSKAPGRQQRDMHVQLARRRGLRHDHGPLDTVHLVPVGSRRALQRLPAAPVVASAQREF